MLQVCLSMNELWLPPGNKGFKIAVLKISEKSQEHIPVGDYLKILGRCFKKIAKNNTNEPSLSRK